MVSPYGWDLPGGVQAHIQDLALYCMAQGHEVSVIAPAVDESALPTWVISSGRPIAIPYNGAVARVALALLQIDGYVSGLTKGNSTCSIFTSQQYPRYHS